MGALGDNGIRQPMPDHAHGGEAHRRREHAALVQAISTWRLITCKVSHAETLHDAGSACQCSRHTRLALVVERTYVPEDRPIHHWMKFSAAMRIEAFDGPILLQVRRGGFMGNTEAPKAFNSDYA